MSCPFRLVPEQVGPRESRFLGLAQRMSLGLLVLAPAVCEWISPLPESVTGGFRLLHIFSVALHVCGSQDVPGRLPRGVGTYPGSCPDVPRLPPPLGGLPTGLCSTIVCCVPPAARLRSQFYGYKLASTADPLAAWQSSLQTTLPADTSTPRETPTHPGRQLPDRRDNLFPVGLCPPGLISR